MREHILSEIRRLADEDVSGKPPGIRRFERETGIREGSWYGRYWPCWGDALKEAGFSPNVKQEKLDREFILKKVAEAFRHYGHAATNAEFNIYRRNIDKDFPCNKTLASQTGHFGSKLDLLNALKHWCEKNSDFADILLMLPETPIQKTFSTPAKHTEGGVYLLQYGLDFKIGRSDDIERRVKQIGTSLPDRGVLVHEIKTDDPVGIEAYWHRRFADKRRNGEWFRLSPEDVRSFKRRKFQ